MVRAVEGAGGGEVRAGADIAGAQGAFGFMCFFMSMIASEREPDLSASRSHGAAGIASAGPHGGAGTGASCTHDQMHAMNGQNAWADWHAMHECADYK